jgi:transposase InsO family protein
METSHSEKQRQETALGRYAAVSWIEQQVAGGLPLSQALLQAAERDWSGKTYRASTMEEWIYAYRHRGFEGLKPRGRSDRGVVRSLSPSVREALERVRREHPELSVRTLVEHLVKEGVLQTGQFSYPSIYRWLQRAGLDPRSLRRELPLGQGPTKAFEAPLANDIWMADMMYGPVLTLESGESVRTRLFAILDDCSRLCVAGKYYTSESLVCFLDVFKTAVARRGIPAKLYADLGKVFVSHHLQVVCANLNCRLSHAKPYAAWSKGKVERFLLSVQTGFQQQLALQPVGSVEELNRRFWKWLEREYHPREHSALGTNPANRFAERSGALRMVSDPAELDRLFLMHEKRRVRKDATLSLRGQLWEVDLALRGRVVDVHYDPFNLQKVEIYFADRCFGRARACDKQLNARTFNTPNNYEAEF